MSLTKRIFFGAAASWFSRGVTILLGLVLLPVLFRTLPKEELGIWLLLGQSWATLGILDLGFGVTLTRRIAFAKGKSGSDPNVALNDQTRAEIADLLATGLHIYRVLAVLAFMVSFGLGFIYLRSLALESVSLPAVWTAWGILCLSQALTVWAAPWTSLLQGVGYIGWDALLATFINAVTLTGQIVVAMCGGGLMSLAVVAAIGALAQRGLVLGFARRNRPELFQLCGVWRQRIFHSMIGVALRAWGTSFGIVLASQTDQLFIAKFQGADEVPAYRAAQVLAVNLNMLAATLAGASSVFISHLWQAGKLLEIHSILRRNLRLGLGLVAIGGATILGLGSRLFDVWLGPGHFIGYPTLIALLAWQFFEVQAHITSSASRATEDEYYLLSSLIGGGVKLVLAWWFVKSLGLTGVALASLVSQLFTNHWLMVVRGLSRLDYSVFIFAADVLGCVVPVGAVAFLTSWLLVNCLADGWSVLLGLAASGCLLVLYAWGAVASNSERTKILRFIVARLHIRSIV